jgi:hypothetical protein
LVFESKGLVEMEDMLFGSQDGGLKAVTIVLIALLLPLVAADDSPEVQDDVLNLVPHSLMAH